MAKLDPHAALALGIPAVPLPCVQVFTRPLPTKAKGTDVQRVQRCVTKIIGFEDLPSPPWNMTTSLPKLTRELHTSLKCGVTCHKDEKNERYEITLQGDHVGDAVLDILAANGIQYGWAECSW